METAVKTKHITLNQLKALVDDISDQYILEAPSTEEINAMVRKMRGQMSQSQASLHLKLDRIGDFCDKLKLGLTCHISQTIVFEVKGKQVTTLEEFNDIIRVIQEIPAGMRLTKVDTLSDMQVRYAAAKAMNINVMVQNGVVLLEHNGIPFMPDTDDTTTNQLIELNRISVYSYGKHWKASASEFMPSANNLLGLRDTLMSPNTSVSELRHIAIYKCFIKLNFGENVSIPEVLF